MFGRSSFPRSSPIGLLQQVNRRSIVEPQKGAGDRPCNPFNSNEKDQAHHSGEGDGPFEFEWTSKHSEETKRIERAATSDFAIVVIGYCAPCTTESALIVNVMVEFSSMLICFE